MIMGVLKIVALVALATSSCLALPGMDDYLSMDSSEHGQQAGSKSTNCSCGWTNKARIVGGKEALANEFPLIAGLTVVDFNQIFCGGTIITPYHVVTAAHCTYPVKGMQILAIVGEHDQSKKSSTTVVIPVEKVIDHEEYYHKMYSNDISLLLLEKKIDFTQTVGPACLPSKRINLVNEQIKVLGWGKLGTNKEASQVLMKVNLRVIPLGNCAETFPRKIIPLDKEMQICTHGGSKKDSCQGDSGGPLIWLDPDTNRYTLVALVSYGKAKCASGEPAVNTNVAAYMDWLQQHIAESKPGVQTCTKV